MLLDKLIPGKYLVKPEVCGLEINFSENGAAFHYTCLSKKNKKVEISLSGSLEGELKLPGSIEKNKIPLVLIFNGKGIILKKIALSENGYSFEDILKENLPAINVGDFYTQLFRTSSSTGYLALIRKEKVMDILQSLENHKYKVAGVLIGAPAIMGLQPLWSNLNSIATTNQRVELLNGEIEEIRNEVPSTGSVQLEDVKLSSLNTLGFAGGLNYFLQNSIAECENDELNNLYQQHVDQNKFRFLLVAAVALAFLLSVINVLFYTRFFDAHNKLETELSVYQGKYEQINKLLSDYQKKKDLIETAGILNKNKLSEYSDYIAKTIPDEVVLSEMYFNPKNENEDSEDSLVTFNTKEIIIKGNCNKSLVINEWVNILKMQKFIKEVSLEKFAYNSEGLLPNYEIKLVTE